MPSGDGHQIYWEVCGSPTGKPAVVLHGEPGSGAPPWWRQFFEADAHGAGDDTMQRLVAVLDRFAAADVSP